MTSPMRFLHAPLHAPETGPDYPQLAARVRAIGAESVAHTEAYGIVDKLAKTKGRRLVLERGGKDTRRGQKDVPILVDASLRSYGSGQIFGCGASVPEKIAPERWFTYSITERKGAKRPVAHLSLHPHAAVQDRKTGKPLAASNDRVKKYVIQMDRFTAILNLFDKLGCDLVVTLDANFRDTNKWAHSPHVIMRNHGLDVVTRGLDAIGSSKALHMKVTEVPGVATDHPWLLGTCGR